jgi:hypothetical protein
MARSSNDLVKVAGLARPKTYTRPWGGCSSRAARRPGGTQNVMVTVLPTASVPAVIAVQLSVRLMIHVAAPELVCSVICVAVNPITVPVSVLFPPKGLGVGRGRGVGVGLATVAPVALVAGAAGLVVVVGVQLTRSAAPAMMQM